MIFKNKNRYKITFSFKVVNLGMWVETRDIQKSVLAVPNLCSLKHKLLVN